REFFLPFMGAAGAAATPLLLDAVVFWLASASVRQARAGRPLPMLRAGAYGLLALTVTANALGGATPAQRVFLALPAALFGFLVEARTRLALYAHRAEHGDDRIPVRLWARHPVRAARAWLWLARQSAPAYDCASAEHDQLRAARHAVALALPGHSRPARRAGPEALRAGSGRSCREPGEQGAGRERPARGRRARPGRLPRLRGACRAAARATARPPGDTPARAHRAGSPPALRRPVGAGRCGEAAGVRRRGRFPTAGPRQRGDGAAARRQPGWTRRGGRAARRG
ncbi:MAG: hypothetical protein ACHP9Z_35205, partial [Streptosporangiales bacterium]